MQNVRLNKVEVENELGKSQIKKMQRLSLISVVFQLILPLFAGVLIFQMDKIQHGKSADYFSRILRSEIIKGSYREAMFQAQRIVTGEGPFKKIQFQNNNGIKIIEVKNKEADTWIDLTIENNILYSDKSDLSAGKLVYVYSSQTSFLFIILFFLISVLATNVFIIRQRRFLSISFENEIENIRNKTVARTVNFIAHDLQAPLSLIDYFLKDIPLNDIYFPGIQGANYGILRIQAMIESLKKNDPDSIVQLKSEIFDLEYLISLGKSLAKLYGKEFNYSADSSIQGRLDVLKIERAIQNMLVNAFEACEKEVNLKISLQNFNLLVEVIDDGHGVPLEVQNKLFQRGATFGKAGGTGLGLAYVKSVIDGHGGELVYQRMGNYSHFKFKIETGYTSPINETVKEKDLNPNKCVTILINIDDKILEDRIVKELSFQENFSIFRFPTSEVEYNLAYISNVSQLDDLPSGHRQIIFYNKSDSLEVIAKKLIFLANQYLSKIPLKS